MNARILARIFLPMLRLAALGGGGTMPAALPVALAAALVASLAQVVRPDRSRRAMPARVEPPSEVASSSPSPAPRG